MVAILLALALGAGPRPDPAPGANGLVTIDRTPYCVTLAWPDGSPAPGWKVVVGRRPSGYAPAGVIYRERP